MTMPNNSSLADTLLEAEQAIASLLANADQLPSAGKHREPLEKALSEVKDLSALQQRLIADKQKVTQDLNAASRRVKDLLLHLRAAVRSDIGPRSEKLVEFKVAPLRPRQRKVKVIEVQKPAV
jgi:hypothetical protein